MKNMGGVRAMAGLDVLGGATGAERQMLRRVIFASVLGNGLEWFDFISYGYFASIISKVFFPSGGDLGLLLTPMPPSRWASWFAPSAESCSARMRTSTGARNPSRC